MSVNVIVPFYQKSETEFLCLNSIIDELMKIPDVETVFLVDDNPQTPTKVDFIKKTNQSNALRLVQNKQNVGFVDSVNTCFSKEHEFNLIINSDVILADFTLDRAIEHLRANDKVGDCQGNVDAV